MESAGRFFIFLGGLFLVGLLMSFLARMLSIPRVSLLLCSGIALGPYGLNLLSADEQEWFRFITDLTLLIVGYLLGARLTPDYLARYAKGVMVSALIITLVTSLLVTLLLILAGVDARVAVILGAIAAATDPVALIDTVRERAHRSGFTDMLEGIVAMDDVFGLLVFSFALAAVALLNEANGLLQPLLHMVYDIFGAVLLGAFAGYVVAKVLNAKRAGKPVIVESLAFILLLGGVAMYLQVSFLLAAMVMGAVVVNLADKETPHLHEIESIEEPFLVLFFLIAGAALNFSAGLELFYLLLLFVVFRLIGRYLGGWLVPTRYLKRRYKNILGISLLPQAGVAMGMALVASQTYPEIAGVILPLTISATVVFEVLGPLATSRVLGHLERKEGEIRQH